MENLALIDSFSEFKDDKLIDRVTLMAILEDVFRSALKKKYGSDDNFDIINVMINNKINYFLLILQYSQILFLYLKYYLNFFYLCSNYMHLLKRNNLEKWL